MIIMTVLITGSLLQVCLFQIQIISNQLEENLLLVQTYHTITAI